MIPGTALGVLVGDLIYTAMAFRLARQDGPAGRDGDAPGPGHAQHVRHGLPGPGPGVRQAATGRGLDPERGGPARLVPRDRHVLASGVFKLACAPVSGWIRRIVPRAGLLGSLAAIALVIISFLPLLDIAAQPVAGLAALAVILATLTARWELPGRSPGPWRRSWSAAWSTTA